VRVDTVSGGLGRLLVASALRSDRVMADQTTFLAQLDEASQNGVFPYPQHERMDYGGMRVHAYKGKKDFALLFEMLMFDHEVHRIEGTHGFCNQVFLYKGEGEGAVWDDELLPVRIKRVKGTPSISLTEDNDEHIETRKERQRLNPKASAILLRGKQIEVPQDAAAYKAHGIKPQKPIVLPDVLRYLLAIHRDDMFSTDAERAKLLPKMTKLLTLDRWRHYTLDDEAPSDTEAMQMLADVLVTGDISKYAPTEKPNTERGASCR
jgi:hypothetical protein